MTQDGTISRAAVVELYGSNIHDAGQMTRWLCHGTPEEALHGVNHEARKPEDQMRLHCWVAAEIESAQRLGRLLGFSIKMVHDNIQGSVLKWGGTDAMIQYIEKTLKEFN